MAPRERWLALFNRQAADRIPTDYTATLPFGTPAEVDREVAESVAIYQEARWICAPCHRLQPVTPAANILALYETILALGERKRV